MCMLHFVYNKTVIHYLRAFYHQCSHTKTILGLTLQSLVHIQDLSFTNNGSNVKRYQMFKKQVQLKEHQDQDDECLTPLLTIFLLDSFVCGGIQAIWRKKTFLYISAQKVDPTIQHMCTYLYLSKQRKLPSLPPPYRLLW